jgi:hypothetical protein
VEGREEEGVGIQVESVLFCMKWIHLNRMMDAMHVLGTVLVTLSEDLEWRLTSCLTTSMQSLESFLL